MSDPLPIVGLSVGCVIFAILFVGSVIGMRRFWRIGASGPAINMALLAFLCLFAALAMAAGLAGALGWIAL